MRFGSRKLGIFRLMKKNSVGLFGLIFNGLGAFLLAVSLSGDSGAGAGTDPTYGLAMINSFYSNLGLYLFILGFSFQFLEKIHSENKIKLLTITLTTIFTAIIFFVSIKYIPKLIFYPY